MNLQVTDLDADIARIALEGRLDASAVDRIETQFVAAVARSGRNALVDLSGVTFIASMGLRMLISTGRALRQKNARMVLVAPQALVKEVLDQAALGDIIPVVDEQSRAVELLRG